MLYFTIIYTIITSWPSIINNFICSYHIPLPTFSFILFNISYFTPSEPKTHFTLLDSNFFLFFLHSAFLRERTDIISYFLSLFFDIRQQYSELMAFPIFLPRYLLVKFIRSQLPFGRIILNKYQPLKISHSI